MLSRIGFNLLFLVPGAVGGSEISARSLLREIARLEPDLELVYPPNRPPRLGAWASPLGGRAHDLLASPTQATARFERRDDIHQALLTIGCCLVCFKQLQRAEAF